MGRETETTYPRGDEREYIERKPERKAVPDTGPPKSGKYWLAAGCVAFVLALCLPQTGWIMRLQMRLLAGNRLPAGMNASMGSQTPSGTSKGADLARTMPNDLEVQIALILGRQYTSAPPDEAPDEARRRHLQSIDNLYALKTRFPDRPELDATILRYMCQSVLPNVPRDGDWLLERGPGKPEEVEQKRKAAEERRKAYDLARLAQFEQAAKNGERCDPDNAFFPQMLAVVLFATDRDEEAIAAIHRAGAKSRWEDFADSELTGRFRVIEKTEGEVGTVPRMAVAAALLFPHYAAMRSMSRVAIYDAAQKEKAGDKESGFAIRHDVARIGAMMRVQGKWIITSLVGMAFTNLASEQPEGVITVEQGAKDDRRADQRAAAYVTYLNRIGHPDEATWYVAEREKQKAAKNVTSHIESGLWDSKRLLSLMALWAFSMILLMSALFMSVLGGIATVIAGMRHFRQSRPLPIGVSFGFTASALALGLSMVVMVNRTNGGISPDTLIGVIGPGVMGMTILFCMLKYRTRQGFGKVLGQFAATLVGTLLVAGGLYGAVEHIGGLIDMPNMLLLEALGEKMPPLPESILIWGWALGLSAYFGRATWRARKEGLPASVALVRDLRNRAMGKVGMFLLLAAAASVPLSMMESATMHELSESIRHEGSYLARNMTAQGHPAQWPGPVEERKP